MMIGRTTPAGNVFAVGLCVGKKRYDPYHDILRYYWHNDILRRWYSPPLQALSEPPGPDTWATVWTSGITS